MAAFTVDQRAKVRYHMGLPDSERVAVMISGERAEVGVVFAVDRTLALLNDSAKPKLLQLVDALENTEEKLFKLAGSREFSELGKLKMNSNAVVETEQVYDAIGKRLASFLGLPYRRWRQRGDTGSAGSINGRWSR